MSTAAAFVARRVGLGAARTAGVSADAGAVPWCIRGRGQVARRSVRGYTQSSVLREQDAGSGAMEDEYGTMDDSGLTFAVDNLKLESGIVLESPKVRYKTWGTLNKARDNVLVVCHALTGNASLDTWWGDFLGPGLPFDTDKYFIICANLLGSCYGSTGPTETDPATGKRYGPDFPFVTIRDAVALNRRLLREGEGVESVKCVIGGSLGGMQCLEWLLSDDLDPDYDVASRGPFVKSSVPMACGGYHHAWQIAISEAQRQAIVSDPTFRAGYYEPAEPPRGGISVARQFAMISYRSHEAYEMKFGRAKGAGADSLTGAFEVENYLHYQGDKFISRFDANSYITLTRLMDSHDIGRARGGLKAAGRRLTQPVHIVGIDSDALYPVSEQEDLKELLPNADLSIISTPDGHDGFLLAQDQLAPIITDFLDGLP